MMRNDRVFPLNMKKRAINGAKYIGQIDRNNHMQDLRGDKGISVRLR